MAYITGMDKTEVSDTATFQVGQKGMDSAGNTFKYVQYDTGAGSVAAVSGQVAYYYAPSGASAGAVNVVTSDLSDSNEVGAGVLQSAPTDGQYCWIQIGGTATLTIALTAGADGDPLTPTGAGDGTLDVTAAATSPVCAFAIDASAKIIACQFAG
jgi:hypothetical protein|tara:strand:+ start:1147 stop:1611 length:465 start_codon:yes stop_codon:yes gene_type:complete